MDLNALRMFVGVVQAGSLSAAARLEIPLPTLSRRVRELEHQLAVQLLERSVRGTRLTEAGMRLYENAARGVEILHEAEQALASDQARLKGRLRLSLPPGFEPWWELLGCSSGAIRISACRCSPPSGASISSRMGSTWPFGSARLPMRRWWRAASSPIATFWWVARACLNARAEWKRWTTCAVSRSACGTRAAAARAPGCSVAKRSSRGSCWRPMTTRICVPAPWMPNWSPSYHRSWLPPRCVRGN